MSAQLSEAELLQLRELLAKASPEASVQVSDKAATAAPAEDPNDDTPPVYTKSHEHLFFASAFTFDRLQRDWYGWSTHGRRKLLQAISACIAHTTDGYAVKCDASAGHGYRIVHWDSKMLRDKAKKKAAWSEIIGIDSKTHKPKYNDNAKPKLITIDWILTCGYYEKWFLSFNGLALMTREPHMLELYVPPKHPKANSAIAVELLDFLRSRVKNKRAIEVEIATHAFRLRTKASGIQLCFVRYSKIGKTGKSFTASVFGLLYPNLASTNIRQCQITEDKNGWITDTLFGNVEELEGEEYVSKHFSTLIKQICAPEFTARKLYQNAYNATINIILSYCTNQPDLYGMVHESNQSAVLSRLCIEEYDSPLTDVEWHNQLEHFGLNKDNPNLADNKAYIGASLYKYLMEDYDLSWYREGRIMENDPDQLALIQRLRKESAQLPDKFVQALEFMDDDQTQFNSYAPMKCLKEWRDRRQKNAAPYVMYSCPMINKAWAEYVKENRGTSKNNNYTEKAVHAALARVGFEEKHTMTGDVGRMVASEFHKWKESIVDEEIDNPFDDEFAGVFDNTGESA